MAAYLVQLQASEVYVYLRDLPRAAARAASRAINGMSPYIRAEAIERIGTVYTLDRRYISRNVKQITRAGPARLLAVWSGRGGPVTLKAYAPRVKPGSTRRNAPVTAEVIRGQRRTVGRGFMGPGGHVYRRKGRARLPIRVITGPGVPSAFANAAVQAALTRTTELRLPGMVESEMVRELRRIETGALPKS